jgi:hypothetical protein
VALYRQESIFGRAGVAIQRFSLGQWVGTCGVRLQPLVDALKTEILQRLVLHADEMPVQMLKPGDGKTHRAYLWAYAPGAFEDIKAVVYDFCESRAGEHTRKFLGEWRGSLTCDDFSGYKTLISRMAFTADSSRCAIRALRAADSSNCVPITVTISRNPLACTSSDSDRTRRCWGRTFCAPAYAVMDSSFQRAMFRFSALWLSWRCRALCTHPFSVQLEKQPLHVPRHRCATLHAVVQDMAVDGLHLTLQPSGLIAQHLDLLGTFRG